MTTPGHATVIEHIQGMRELVLDELQVAFIHCDVCVRGEALSL